MDKLMTTKEVAVRLEVDVSTVSRWVAAGKITPALRLANGQMLFRVDDIAQYGRRPRAAS